MNTVKIIDTDADNADPITNSASFKYKISFLEKTPNNDNDRNNVIQNLKIVEPLKHLSNFWRTLHMPFINCEVSLTLTWSKNYVLTDIITKAAGAVDLPAIDAPAGASFVIKDCKLYVSVVTLSAENNNKLLEQLKTGLKRTITLNKYRSEMPNHTVNNNLNYFIDPTFTNGNRLFVLSYEKETSFSKYYVPKIEIKDFNVLIDGKPFFEIPVKNKEEAYEAIIEMGKDNDYTTGNLLDYEYFKNHYRLIAIDLSSPIELENIDLKQQINFIGRLEEDATMFFIIDKKEETTFDFSQNSVTVV